MYLKITLDFKIFVPKIKFNGIQSNKIYLFCVHSILSSMFSHIINYLNKYILIWYISVAVYSKLPRIIFWVYFNEQTRTVNKIK